MTVSRGEGTLDGIRVIDLSVSLSAAFCTSLLRQLGAAVVHVDLGSWPPGPKSQFLDEHLSRSPVYEPYVNHGKEVVEIDLPSEQGRSALWELLAEADVLVEDYRPEHLEAAGLERETLKRDFPHLVVASVTPFGRSGARSRWPASDLTLVHGGGPGFATPGLVPDPENHPPLRMGSHHGAFVSGLTAAVNVCAALLAKRRAGPAGVSVDFSCHEAMANVFRQSLGTFAYYGGGLNRDLARGRGAGGTADHRNIRCKDGWFNLSWVGVKQWDSLKELMGHPEWMEQEQLADPAQRGRNWSIAMAHLEEWTSQYDKETLFFLLQGNRIPCSPVNDGMDLLDSEALESRGFWEVNGGDGKPAKLPSIRNQFSGVDG